MAFENAWGMPPPATAALIVVALGIIIFGGVTRIARFAEIVVPFMAMAYVLVALVIMVINVEQIPRMFALIFKSAFGLEARFGAVLGLAVQWGVKRGVYSNEAGQGTGPHAAAAAEVSILPSRATCRRFRSTSTRCWCARQRRS